MTEKISSANSTPELSSDVLEALNEKFSGEEREKVAAALRQFSWPQESGLDERIHLDILHAAGDLGRIIRLVELAKKDWRDVIMATEYDLKYGKPLQTQWSKDMAKKREAKQNSTKI